MDLEVIERLMQMLSSSDVEELDVTEGNLRIRLAKHARGSDTPIASRQNAHSAIPAPISAEAVVGSDLHTIVAGLPGTFYRAPAPGAAPFVDVGDGISDGQQLAIVEAMKMMNPVEADCDGTVLEILLDDAAAVQPGTPLFRIGKMAG
ncbi:acetyl-CoA carboxylase biotin carboxyl carrier protein [Rhizobium sp. ARZ01]|uniref:acetyl-CoA carboxylase biotin carboxyl carrier protein n=1 Tax=Rhizobium sp. ARZ01 TaxID=2769313 RepID=UPI0017800595|nr:acetyl-CoA carboxylase biotin carboxyl carrier protein [Rhizobium sp. ARZ01]MBD9374030.1 acetyl-CoA carboxylase biotin carboxyl carrier protein [Rhizobium sp. ARZ01]